MLNRKCKIKRASSTPFKACNKKRNYYCFATLTVNFTVQPKDRTKFENQLKSYWKDNFNVNYHEGVKDTTIVSVIEIPKPIKRDQINDATNEKNKEYIQRRLKDFKEDCCNAMNIINSNK